MYKIILFLTLFFSMAYPQTVYLDGTDVLQLQTAWAVAETKDWTMEFWVYRPTQTQAYLWFTSGPAAFSFAPHWYINGSSICAPIYAKHVGPAANIIGDDDCSTLYDRWHHIALVHDAGDSLKLYQGGVDIPDTLAKSAAQGWDMVLEYLGGANVTPSGAILYLDDLRCWNIERSLADINLYKDIELLGTEDSLKYYWKFNDNLISSGAIVDTLSSVAGSITYVENTPLLLGKYYIDVDKGDDTNYGTTPALALASLDSINTAGITLEAGDVVYFRTDDTFDDTLTVLASGTSGNQITFTYYDSTGESGAYPIISQIDVNDKDYITISNCLSVTNGIINTGAGYVLDKSVCGRGYDKRFKHFPDFPKFKRH